MAAILAVISVIVIIYYIFSEGIKPFLPNNQFIKEYVDKLKNDPQGQEALLNLSRYFDLETYRYHFWNFITGTTWHPSQNVFGVGFMIISSILSTIGALLFGVPVAILTAVFISEVAPKKLASIVRPAVELLAAIPSVLYGVFGAAVIVPMISRFKLNILGSSSASGTSLLAVVIVLSIMILPTVITICETAIRAVPKDYKEGSLALGASKIQTIFKVVLPAARSGILAAVVLGIGRAIGETMAVILVAGNPEQGIPTSLLDPVRLLTTNIALEQGYAAELHAQMLFSTAIVLFFFIMLVNMTLLIIKRKLGDR
ncbi:phosphate ABC transporter permease subunit PstC [Mycoplasmatota bacterium]|nr:phosphate ABC transporter permease subunit PstC [Mycoplasmatota bacterium]